MSLAQKMLKNNGVTPSADSGNNGTGNQSGNQGGSENNAGEENNGSTGSPDSGQGGNNNDQNNNGGNNSGTGQAENNGNGGSGSENSFDEAATLKVLNEQGINIKSLSELKAWQEKNSQTDLTDDQKEAIRQQRINAARAHGLTTGKVKSTEIDAFVRESALPVVDLAYQLYKGERLAELEEAKTPQDQLPSEQDLRAEFEDLHFLKADPTDVKRKRAEKVLANQVNEYLQETYANVYGLEDDYNEHEQTTQLRSTYNQTVETVMSSLGDEIPFTFKDDKTEVSYKVKFTPEEKAVLKEVYGNDASFNAFGRGGATADVLTEAMKGTLIAKHFPKIIAQVAQAHADAKTEALKKGRRNAFNNVETGNESGEKKTNPRVKGILNKNPHLQTASN